MQVTLRALLEAQNPWWADPTARAAGALTQRRGEFAALRGRLLDPEAAQVLLVGPRQAGKTTLLWQLVDSLLDEVERGDRVWSPHQVVYFSFQDERLGASRITLRDVVEAHVGSFPDIGARPCVYLLDEIGQSPDWDLSLKHLHSESIARGRAPRRFIVTDSAVHLLDAKSRVAGRFVRFRLPFLPFPDFVRFRQDRGDGRSALSLELVGGSQFDAYLEQGGSMAHLHAADPSAARAEIRRATASSVQLDLPRGARVRRPDQAARLFAALAADSGTLLNATARGADLGVPRQTVVRWVDVLCETGLIVRLDAATHSARERSRLSPRVYCADPGMVAAFSLAPQPMQDAESRGRIVETAILVHLLAALERLHAGLAYGTGKAECDFVLTLPEATLAIQVTAGRAANPNDAWKAARAARALQRGRPLVVSRHPQRIVHDVEGLAVPEVPAWLLCDRLVASATSKEFLQWLQA